MGSTSFWRTARGYLLGFFKKDLARFSNFFPESFLPYKFQRVLTLFEGCFIFPRLLFHSDGITIHRERGASGEESPKGIRVFVDQDAFFLW